MEKKFKSFDKVLVRIRIDAPLIWTCTFYSHLDKDGCHVTIGGQIFDDKDILPYEGNEELVGTTNEPKIPLSEKEIQDAYWNNCTEKEKENLRNSYNVFLKDNERGKLILEKTCGKHNLQAESPDEEVRLEEGEWIFVASEVYNWAQKWSLIELNHIEHEQFCTGLVGWCYAVKYSDFNPYNMKETMKHILCVKNDKIVKYKG